MGALVCAKTQRQLFLSVVGEPLQKQYTLAYGEAQRLTVFYVCRDPMFTYMHAIELDKLDEGQPRRMTCQHVRTSVFRISRGFGLRESSFDTLVFAFTCLRLVASSHRTQACNVLLPPTG